MKLRSSGHSIITSYSIHYTKLYDDAPGGAHVGAISFLAGRDTRESGDWIERELAWGIRSQGGSLTSAGVVPTPAIAYLTPRLGYSAGVVISAS